MGRSVRVAVGVRVTNSEAARCSCQQDRASVGMSCRVNVTAYRRDQFTKKSRSGLRIFGSSCRTSCKSFRRPSPDRRSWYDTSSVSATLAILHGNVSNTSTTGYRSACWNAKTNF